MSEIKKLYTLDEVCKALGKTRKELLPVIEELFPDYAKRIGHKFTEDELSQIKTAIENNNS